MNEFHLRFSTAASEIKTFLEKGGDPNYSIGSNRWSLLHQSCFLPDGQECVSLLIKLKANPSPISSLANTPLHFAASRGRVESVKILIEAKAQIDLICESDGLTPLADAIKQQQGTCVEMLLDAGAKMSRVSSTVYISPSMQRIISERRQVKWSILVFIGIARKHPFLKRDMAQMIGRMLWKFRNLWYFLTDTKRIRV